MSFPLTVDSLIDNTTVIRASHILGPQRITVGPIYFNVKSDQYSGGAIGDGVADDAPAINAAIAAAALVGGVVVLPPGTYRCASTLSLTADNITVQGSGWNTIIKAANNLNADLITTPTTSGSNRNYCVIRDVQLDGNKGNQSAGHIVHWYGTRYCQLDRCLLVNAFDHALNLDGDSGSGFGFNNTITNNVFDLNNGVITDSNNEANYVSNNQFKWCGVGHMANMTSGGHYFIGNVFGSGGTYTVSALELGNGLSSKIIGNRFDQTRHQSVKCNAGNQIIIGNEFFKCCSSTSNVDSVIHIGANNANVVIGNIVRTDAAVTWKYAVHQDNPSDFNLVADNQLTAGLSGTIQSDGGGTGSNKWINNIGFNPQGVAGITVTSSPFTYTNIDSVPELISIDGGTVTTVAKNSTTLYNFGATTARCAIWLEPGEAVTVTYTVTPTMNKDRK